MALRFTRLRELPDVVQVDLEVRRDDRGWFAETFVAASFADAGIAGPFVQDDHAASAQLVLRGFHYQIAPEAQGKLVRCVAGNIHDVVVDLRRASPTFGRHVAVSLSSAAPSLLWIPPGFAHGYLTLSKWSEVVYKQTRRYSPAHARRIRWDDPDLAIPWPLEGAVPLLSRSDAAAPGLREAELNFD